MSRGLLLVLLLAGAGAYVFFSTASTEAADRATASSPGQASVLDGSARGEDEPSAQLSNASGESALEALFAAADRSPDGLTPLLLEVSRRIAATDDDARDALALRLEPYARRAFFGPEGFDGMGQLGIVVHRVASGEVPGAIARRYGFSDGLLGRLNQGYAPRSLRVGQELKVLDLRQAELQLVVDRERHRLAAWRRSPAGDGRLLMLYVTVGLGAPATPTPAGATKVVERVLDPEWTDPNSGIRYAPDDPGNLLGGYWMRLDERGIGKQGIGLHGFTGEDPSAWLGQNASNGCVRMLQDDMDRVFHLALAGTAVQLGP